MKILYVSQYFPPEMGAPAARVAELSRIWAEEGHEVTVLTGFPNHPTGVLLPEYRDKFRQLVVHERSGDVSVVRTWLLPLPNRKVWERILNYASFCVSAASTGMFLARPDIVVATSPQLLVGLSGWWLAACKRAPFVLEVRDLWPESLAAVGTGGESSLMYRGLAKLAAFLYQAADRIAVVTPAFKEHLMKRWQVPSDRVEVIENGVDGTLFHQNHETQDIRRQMDAEGKLVVSYIGTIGLAHGLQTLMETASCLQKSAPHIVFWLVGEGAEKEQMVALARSRGLTNVRFIGQQPRERIPSYICASDVCLALLKKEEVFKTVLPTKMLEFMSCGRPVILAVDGYARKIVEDASAGIFVEPENSAQLIDAVLRLAGDPSLQKTLGSNGRRYVQQNFNRQLLAQRYLRCLNSLLDPGIDLETAAA